MEKRYTEKVAKEKRSQFGPIYNPKVVSARPPPPMQRSNGMIKLHNLQQCIIIPVHAAVGSQTLQGDQGDNRNGQKIMVRSIDLRGTVEVAKHSGSDFDDECEPITSDGS